MNSWKENFTSHLENRSCHNSRRGASMAIDALLCCEKDTEKILCFEDICDPQNISQLLLNYRKKNYCHFSAQIHNVFKSIYGFFAA